MDLDEAWIVNGRIATTPPAATTQSTGSVFRNQLLDVIVAADACAMGAWQNPERPICVSTNRRD